MWRFSSLYERVLQWSRHPHATRYLAVLSFAESSFFPVPPDVMLAPMALARRERAWFFAAVTTLTSVAGGVAGYLIGLLALEWITPLLHTMGYWEKYLLTRDWFEEWGVWVIFIAGFSPIPYKVFTITAGAVALSFFPFVLASFVGRGMRFYLVAGIIYVGGEAMEQNLRKYIDVMGWTTVVVLIVAYAAYELYW
ncbi:MAG: YqaA family protein [Gammaproteobacteria bacterium]|nr:MAG: YqaA family protein [Gammaproteobacteria bacterium]